MIDEILMILQTDIGPVPGRYSMKQSQSIFKLGITPMLKQLLNTYGLRDRPIGPASNCSDSKICQSRFVKYVSFLKKMNFLYPMKLTSFEFLAERPGKLILFDDCCKQSLRRLLNPPIHPPIHPHPSSTVLF